MKNYLKDLQEGIKIGERNYILLENDGIYLYSQWDTVEELVGLVKSALKRGKDRWNDRQYLNRIIFSELIKNDVLGLTRYGLSNDIWDGQIVININVEKQTVNGISFEKMISD